MSFELHILGANSALPAFGRLTSCQVLQVFHAKYMIDCGEGAQISLYRQNLRPSKIKQIFISHLHGDHIYGLPGLISSFSLQNRSEDLTIFGPPGLKKFMDTICEISHLHLSFRLDIIEIDPGIKEQILEDDLITVNTIPLTHRIPTCGFLFKEKKADFNIRKDVIEIYNIDVPSIIKIKEGADFISHDGKKIPNKELVHSPKKSRSYAYCSDTRYNPAIIPQIKGVDLLYHEATFLHRLVHQAEYTQHSTAKEAALIAKAANVGKLIIGHFSSRYMKLEPLLEEAKQFFENSYLAEQDQTFYINN